MNHQLSKVEKIRNSLAAVRERRKQQQTLCIEFGIVLDKQWSKDYFYRLFNEFKWLYNWTLVDFDNRKKPAEKAKVIEIKVGDHFEQRELKYLGSLMKQAVVANIIQNMRALKERKKRGYKIGSLKFKSECTTVYFPTQGFKIKGNRLVMSKMPRGKSVYLRGMKQLKKLQENFSSVEFGDSKVVRKADKFYFQLTVHVPKTEWNQLISERIVGDVIGIDFGIKHPVVFSNGIKLNFSFPETKRLKKLQRKLSKQKKRSKNYWKTRLKIRKEHLKLVNQKRNVRNQILGYTRKFETVCYQKELVKQWHEGWFGKQIQNTSVGSIVESLSRHSNPMVVESEIPTTQMCHICGQINKVTLDERMYTCKHCGATLDRDVHSAINMIKHHFKNTYVPLEQGELTPVEMKPLLKRWFTNVCVSFVDESGSQVL